LFYFPWPVTNTFGYADKNSISYYCFISRFDMRPVLFLFVFREPRVQKATRDRISAVNAGNKQGHIKSMVLSQLFGIAYYVAC
jgi:hypothetical protein